MKGPHRNTLFSAAFIFVGLFGMTILSPSLPSIQHDLAISRFLVKAAITGYLFSYGVVQLFYGPLSDAYGRKPIILMALSLLLLGNLITANALSGYIFIMGHTIAGLGAGAGSTIPRAILRDTFDGVSFTKQLSFVILCATLGTNTGPIAGGVIQHSINWRANFWTLGLLSSIIIIATLMLMEETNKARQFISFKRVMKQYVALCFSRTFICSALMIALTFAVSIAYVVMTPFLYQINLHISPLSNGLLMVFPVISIFLGTFCLNAVIDSLAEKTIILIGIVCYLFAGLLLLYFGLQGTMSLAAILLPSLLTYFALGFCNPVMTSYGIRDYKNTIGLAGALQATIKVLGAAMATFVFAKVFETNQIPLAVVDIVASILLLILFVLAFGRKSLGEAL